jgi:hypothetical protein
MGKGPELRWLGLTRPTALHPTRWGCAVKVEDDEDEIVPAPDDQTVTDIAEATATAPTDPRPSKKRKK